MVASENDLNPFTHHVELTTTYDKIRTAFFTVVILPIRLAIIAALLIFAWCLACIGLYGLTEEDLCKKPIKGWRSSVRDMTRLIFRFGWMIAGFHYVTMKGKQATKNEAPILVLAPHSSFVDSLAISKLGSTSGVSISQNANYPIFGIIREWICILGRYAYSAGGMHITVKGEQASRAEAPILVIAPHSTFLDAAIVYVTGFPSIIVRRESGMNPWLGKLINFTQPVHVRRDDPNSRQRTIQDIIDRTTSKEDWPQVLIFPEGTCTNRSCLITFKPGAFIPGVPVQPVLIRYPNKLDTVTWTWYGPGAVKLLWLTLTRAYSNCEVELLPVYTPSEEEKKDPKLYAHNVRNLMAEALGIPTSDYTYEDTAWLIKAETLEFPQASQIMKTLKLRTKLGLTKKNTESELIGANFEIFKGKTKPKLLTKEEFTKLLDINETDAAIEELFDMYSQQENKELKLNLQNYLLAVHLTMEGKNRKSMIRIAFDCYDGSLTKEKFQYLMQLIYSISNQQSEQIFVDISEGKSKISFDEYLKYVQMFPDVLCENNNATQCDRESKKDN